jgi:hypothetical protein
MPPAFVGQRAVRPFVIVMRNFTSFCRAPLSETNHSTFKHSSRNQQRTVMGNIVIGDSPRQESGFPLLTERFSKFTL